MLRLRTPFLLTSLSNRPSYSGWQSPDNKPNEEITAKDMFENGNKVGNMEASTVMDSDGDIDKMVGTMGD